MAREIEIEYGYEGQLLWPPGSPSHKVSEKILFREVVPIDWTKIWDNSFHCEPSESDKSFIQFLVNEQLTK